MNRIKKAILSSVLLLLSSACAWAYMPPSMVKARIDGSNIKALATIKTIKMDEPVIINGKRIGGVKVQFETIKSFTDSAAPVLNVFTGNAIYYATIRQDGTTSNARGTMAQHLNENHVGKKVLVFINDEAGRGTMLFCHLLSDEQVKEIETNGLENVRVDLRKIEITHKQ